MAGQSVVVVALVVVLAALVNGNVCKPNFNPKPDCRKRAGEGWEFFKGMGYKYFPKGLTWKDANAACKPWDEEICSASRGWQSYLASYLTDGELEGAFRKAYDAACIKNGYLFWSGVKKSRRRSKLYYEDSVRSSSSKHAFPDDIPSLREGRECVAFDMSGDRVRMVVLPCDEELGYLCKIMPTRH
nr:hypothetical protein [Paracentrotus lividus]